MTDPERGRRAFVPVVLVGLAAAALAAVAGNQPWAVAEDGAGSADDGLTSVAAGTGAAEFPVSGALALVVLASWGVLLVSRGRFRRLVSAVGLMASLAMLVTVVVGYDEVTDSLREALVDLAVPDTDVSHTAWYWVAAVAAAISVAATGLAVRWVPAWPEMGTRYDAPADRTGRAETAKHDEPSTHDLWKAMDEGRDPTS